VYVNRFPDGRLTLTCAHCAIDAELEQAEAIALYAEGRRDGQAIAWEDELTPEQVIGAAADQCMHLAAYRASSVSGSRVPGDPSS
jgi:hypothetical protein